MDTGIEADATKVDAFVAELRRIGGELEEKVESVKDLPGGRGAWIAILAAVYDVRKAIGQAELMKVAKRPSKKPKTPNYTYIECADCKRRGTARCRRPNERWDFCVIPGCMELIENAPKYLKVPRQEKR